MISVILTIHVLIVLGLIGIVLLQRSEGGALGIGGGGGGFMSGRGAANALTRTTSILAALFFTTSILLAVFADRGETDLEIIEDLTVDAAEEGDARAVFGGAADALGVENGGGDEAPSLDPSDALKVFGADAPPEALESAPQIAPEASTSSQEAPAAQPAEETTAEDVAPQPQGTQEETQTQ